MLYTWPAILLLCLISFAVLTPGLAFLALICLFMLAVCVIAHELAHLAAAKRSGMDVREFSIGFGRRVCSRRWRGIRWSLRMLPLGGSVEVAGMTVEEVERTKVSPQAAFIYKSPFARLRVALAGVAANVGIAWLALTVAVIAVGRGEDPSLHFYLMAPLLALAMIGMLLKAGAASLTAALFNWNDSSVASVLSLPRGFAEGASESLNQGLPLSVYFLMFFAVLNLSLGLFNVLPLHPLDGYHGMTALVDGVRRRRARARRAPFAPLSTWRLRWVSWVTGGALAFFVGSVLARDVVQMM